MDMRDETVPNKPKLLDELRTALRMKHYSYRTEQSYVYWARRFILFHDEKHPDTMGAPEVRAFCSHLAVAEHVLSLLSHYRSSETLTPRFPDRLVLDHPDRSHDLPRVVAIVDALLDDNADLSGVAPDDSVFDVVPVFELA